MGCVAIVIVAMVVNVFQLSFSGQLDVGQQFLLWGIVAAIIGFVILGIRRGNAQKLQNLKDTVTQIQQWIDSPVIDTPNFLSEKGEKTLFDLPNIQLMEYISSGSTYQSVHGGVIVPIVGRVSGIAGVSRGESTKKPATLTSVDNGKVIITDKQIVFIGEKENREWPFAKMLDVQPGPNGLWVKLAASSQKKNGFLQHTAHDQLPIGVAVGIATAWVSGSEAEAKKYATDLIAQFNQTIAEHSKSLKPTAKG
jgi:hypothetical protein